jgi:UDP-N-acetylglucosamine--N-acetylmuramyl-(pentapeptide) pyrophosphoryl-undecaprenol N-acetylglucosamine transferase
MKILIPGGHLTPALGLIDWLNTHHTQDEVVFVGRIYSQPQLQQKAVEAEEVKKRGVQFIPFKAVKLGKENPLSLLYKSAAFILSFFRALKIIQKLKPDVMMSFGGYLAVPLALACRFKQIPVMTHEGTRVVGLANKILFKLSNRVAYTYPNLINYDLSQLNKPAVQTGTPLRELILQKKGKKPDWLKEFSNDQPLLLILGGNQGALSLNEFVKNNLKLLTRKFIVVHQCGRANQIADYPAELQQTAQKLGVSKKYYALAWIEESDLVWLYQHADLALSRAGANTLEELIYYQLPAILVPLPHSHFNEQQHNAGYLATQQAAYLLEQTRLNWNNFHQAASQILTNRQSYAANLAQLRERQITNAAQKIYQQLQQLASV